ncbi:MAG: type II secretion system protein [Bacillota bacterium]
MNSEKGFTLIEVLVAVTIFGIGFAIFIEGFSIVTTTIERNRDTSYVMNWADDKIVEYINGDSHNPYGDFTYNNKYFDWNITTSRLPEDIENPLESREDLRLLELRVEWPSNSGRRSYSIKRVVLTGEED